MNSIPSSLTCPVCTRVFDSPLVVGFRVGEKESDFCPRYLDGNPLPQMMHLCPDCGYVGFEPDFRPLKDEELRATLRTVLSRFEVGASGIVSGPERFRRAAVLAVYLAKSNAEIANLYLQATWCSRLDGEPEERERHARRKAIDYFEKALEADEFEDVDKPVVFYLLGELNRRLGRTADALLAFSRLDEYEQVDEWLKIWRDRQRDALKPGSPRGGDQPDATP